MGKKRLPYKTSEFLKEVLSHMNFYNGHEECYCLIEVTAWTYLSFDYRCLGLLFLLEFYNFI
jgi:hypothetical protein